MTAEERERAGAGEPAAEELLPKELARAQAAPPVPRASDWLPPGEEAAPSSIAAMAAEAEKLASDSAPAAERELEPPAWVASEPPREAEAEPAPEPEAAWEPPAEGERPRARRVAPGEAAAGTISLSLAELDELRGLGMSVTQAKRVIRYREQRNGFTDLDELDRMPGFPRDFLARIRDRVVP
jgi:Helix-hairpin-helix motif